MSLLTGLGLVAVVLLILANGYFVAAEFAYVAARRGKLEDRAEAGDRKSGRAVRVHKRLSFMLSGAQLGITVTSLVVGFIAEPSLGRALEPLMGVFGVPERARFGVALTVGFVLATAAQMVVGELAPKNLAIAKPEPVARALAGSTLLYLRIAGPVIRLFDGAANRLLRALGIEPVEELAGGVSVEELDLIVEESAERGKLTARQATLLERAIDFGALQASAAMVPWNRVATLASSSSCEDLRRRLGETHSRFPVLGDGGEVAGVVHAKDLFEVDDDSLATTRVVSLARSPLVVPETATLRTVLAELRRAATEMAIVADEYGAPAGIVTLEDLVEELVGDISDEYDPVAPLVTADDDGCWTIPGSWRVDEIERTTGIGLPTDGAYDTIGGLVLARLQRLARPGDRVEVDEVGIEVLTTDGWAVGTVRLTPPEPDPDDEDDDRRRNGRPSPTTDGAPSDHDGRVAASDRPKGSHAPGADDDPDDEGPDDPDVIR